MSIFDTAIQRMAEKIAGYMRGDKEAERQAASRRYFTGEHPRQLAVKIGQYDDNLTLNHIGLAIARGVSRLFKGGISFVLPEQAQQDYIDAVWDGNKGEQLCYQLGLNGAVYGTPYLKIVPDGTVNKLTGDPLPRLVALDPEITRVEVDPFDVDEPKQYVIEFTVDETTYKEVTRRTASSDYVFQNPDGSLREPTSEEAKNLPKTWIVEHFILNRSTGGQWQPDPDRPPVEWPYDFPPIHHWKNLPSLKADKGCYGSTDAEWAVAAQDKLNFAEGNINKTIRLNAAPPTIGTGITQKPDIATGPGTFTWFSNENAKVYNLPANADIDGSRAFAGDLQSAIFQLMREVPPAVIEQLGSGLTNFVMRVVFSDAIDKNDTKRELYGDALLEVVRRLLILADFVGPASDPGFIEWGPDLPTNPTEQIEEDKFLLESGLISKQTLAERYDIDWEAEQKLIEQEQSAANANSDNIGAAILRNFSRGGVANEQPPQLQEQQNGQGVNA